ncbi:MAG: hypothetical protein QXX17_08275 [Conexivisphaerales archaeon]
MKAILAGLLIREIFSFWTGHPFDFELWVRLGYYTLKSQNPYGFLPEVPGLSFSNIFSASAGATIAYLPFWPLITAGIYYSYLLSGVHNRFFYYFLLKQPIIICDILVAYFIYRYVKDKNPAASEWALLFWLFLPYTIIISSIWGMFDSISVLFVILSLISTSYKRSFWNGMATFAKSIPVIYMLPISSLKLRRLFISLAIPILPSLLIFYLTGWSFETIGRTLGSTIIKEGESMSVWEVYYVANAIGLLKFITPFISNVIGLIWIPAILIVTYLAWKKFGFNSDYGLVQSLLLITLTFFIFKTRINEQYLLYFLLLAIIDIAVWNRGRAKLLYAIVAVATLFLVVNNFFMLNFVSPLFPNIISIINMLNQQIGTARLIVKSILGLLFTILNIMYIRLVVRPTFVHDNDPSDVSSPDD